MQTTLFKENNTAACQKRKVRTNSRNEAIRQEFNRLYNQSRLRYDDCINSLSKTFFISPLTTERIIKQKHT